MKVILLRFQTRQTRFELEAPHQCLCVCNSQREIIKQNLLAVLAVLVYSQYGVLVRSTVRAAKLIFPSSHGVCAHENLTVVLG